MGIVIGDGLLADGVLIDAPPPLGKLWFPLTSGLTVLYGRNGVGKSKLLGAIHDAMRGVKSPYEDHHLSLHVSLDSDLLGFDQRALYEVLRSVIEGSDDWANHAEDHPLLSRWEGHYGNSEEMLEALRELIRQGLDHYLSKGSVHTPRLALLASGTHLQPEFQLWLSAVPVDPVEFADEVANRPHDEHPVEWCRQQIESARSGLPGVPVFLVPLLDATRPHCTVRLPARFIVACVSADEQRDLDADTREFLLLHAPDDDDFLPEVFDARGSFQLHDDVLELMNSLNARATSVHNALTGIHSDIQLVLSNPNELFRGGAPLTWTVTDEHGNRIGIDDLGSGMARWARLAISLTLSVSKIVRRDQPVVALVDEPERALHPTAQHRVAQAFSTMSQNAELGGALVFTTIVASHSPAFFQPGSNLIHVSRGTDSLVSLDEINVTDQVMASVTMLGITPADALQLISWFVFVEGEHDIAVLESLYGEHLKQRHAKLVPMRGASNIEAHVTAEFLLTYSDAHLRVVLDRIGQSAAQTWSAARESFNRSAFAEARRYLEKIGSRSDRESRWLCEAGLAALNKRVLDRIDVVGLQEFDIIAYLPVEMVVPGATSWVALTKEWHADGNGLSFKMWLRKAKAARISPDRLKDLSGFIENRRDLDKVIEGL